MSSLRAFELPYGEINRGLLTMVNQADLFKGRYKVETQTIEATCNTVVDLKVLLGAMKYQQTLIDYVVSELFEYGICELKYKKATITDTEWNKPNKHKAANEIN